MGEQPFAARLRKDAAYARRDQPYPENSPLLLAPDEADAIADVLEAIAGVVADSKRHGDCYCPVCQDVVPNLEPWLAALDRRAGREEQG